MARSRLSHQIFVRHKACFHRNHKAQIRNFTTQSKDVDFTPQSETQLVEFANEVAKIIRTTPRWELTLCADYPRFDFSNPCFFNQLLKKQNNVLLNVRFFNWVSDNFGVLPDGESCAVLFDELVEAKACSVAKWFIEKTGFVPTVEALEGYARCLSEAGLVEDAVNVFDEMRTRGFSPGINTWNLGLHGCVKAGKTDLLSKLYGWLTESEVAGEINADTVGYLVEGFCKDGKALEGYETLSQVLGNGLVPRSAAFNKLIFEFGKERNYGRVSELLHTMIARNRAPDIYTYQEVINGLCKSKKRLEAFRVFNDLKNRGYAPHAVMYTTMIHGFCKMGWLGDAQKLWFEMIDKGMSPNEYTYNALIYGFCKKGDFDAARKLFMEMSGKGYGQFTLSYNTLIFGFCKHGRIDEALHLFEEMARKGVVRSLNTYNTLIRGLCESGKIVESKNLLSELLEQGFQPTTYSYTFLIKRLCEEGDVHEAKRFWKHMQSRHLEPLVCTREHIISGLCDQGFFEEALEWLVELLRTKAKPQQRTFETLIQCLSQTDRLDDCLLVLDLMFTVGHILREEICDILVRKFCRENSTSVVTSLEEILQTN